MSSRDVDRSGARRRYVDELHEIDDMYLTDGEAADLDSLRMAWFREDGLSDEEMQRAWELVANHRERFAEDVRTIGPTLTRDEVERLYRSDSDQLTKNEWRVMGVAYELAVQRGGPGVKPRNIVRVLYPVVATQMARRAPQRGRTSPRSRRRTVRRGRARSPGRKSEPEPPPLAHGRRR